jgi:sugar lactone lactonase YvrE/PKD repeat protein
MKTKLFFASCFLIAGLLKAQIITTIAGSGVLGFGGDGGPATAAKLDNPWGGRMDAAGNIYIVESSNSRVRKISTSGIITTVAGNGALAYYGDGGQATAAALNYPFAMGIDAAGNLYICDSYNNVIRKVTTSGIISTVAGIDSAGFNGDGIQATAAGLNDPSGLTFDTNGNLYIADTGNNRIRKISTSGIISTVAGNGTGGYGGDGGQATATELNQPSAVAIDASGNIFIADDDNNRIRMINTAGIISNIAGSGATGPFKGSYSGDGGLATNATISLPSDLIFDKKGNLYICDCDNNRIRKINTAGIISTIAGDGSLGYNGDGELATAAKLNYPGGVFLDPTGNVYIVDQENNRIRKIGSGLSVPHAGFQASTNLACAGSTVTFSDSTINTIVTGWQWSFPNGTLTAGYTLTDSVVKVTYPNPGVYAVSYTATNSAGQDSIRKTAYIHILSNTAMYNTAFTESFETASVPGTDWSTSGSHNSNWMLTSTAAATGNKSVMINNLANTSNDTSILTGPTFNLAAINSPQLTFSMAYQQQLTTNTDKLQVYISTDCGASWISKWARSATALQPASVSGQSTNAFIPKASQFTTYTININSAVSSTNAMFRWVFYAGASSVGNNIYLDDINISSSVAGIETIETEIGLNIYPNPSQSTVNIAFTLAEKHTMSVQLVDMLGRTVESILAQSYAEGESVLTIGNKADYQAGVYFVHIAIDGQGISKKVIIQ